MVNILGIGVALPPYKVDSKNAQDFGLEPKLFGDGAGIATSLSPEYIKATGNRDFKAKPEDTISPAILGADAVRAAVQDAGISIEQIGLLVGDCVTPILSTPAEAHLIGEQLGVKIPSYDITSSTGIFPGQLASITRWKEERIPEYVVAVVSNTPTQRIDYSPAHGSFPRIGDGAAAVVLSAKHLGKFKVLCSEGYFEVEMSGLIRLSKFGFVSVDQQAESAVAQLAARAALEAAKDHNLDLKSTHIVAPQFSTGAIQQVSSKLGISSDRLFDVCSQFGSLWGADVVVALKQLSPNVKSGERILVLNVGPTFNYGYTLLEKGEL